MIGRRERLRARGTGRRPGRGRRPAAGWLRLARHYAGTAIGGYLLLMAVVILYYYGVARVGGAFIESAFTGCALLIALATPVFALASWLAERYPPRAASNPDPPPLGPIGLTDPPLHLTRWHRQPQGSHRDHAPLTRAIVIN